MSRLLALLLLSAAIAPSMLHAACTNPAAVEGEQVYNTDYATMQFCDGTNWISMAASGSATVELDPKVGALTASNFCKANAGATQVICSTPAISLTTDITGNLPITRLNNGTAASASTFWRGDGTWATAGAAAAGVSGAVQFSNGTALSSDAATFFWDNATKRLGIGTTAPAVTLHLATDAGGSLRLERTNGTYPSKWDIVPAQSASHDLAFVDRIASATRLTIDTSGNVGIGTTAPTAKLHVAGHINILGTGIGNAIALTLGRDNPTSEAALAISHVTNAWALGSAAGDFVLRTTASSAKMLFDTSGGTTTPAIVVGANNGNVGIGTTAPSSALDLNGAQTFRGMGAPAVSPAGTGRMYFDSTANVFKVSQNGGAYTTLGGGGALSALTDVALASPANGHVLTYNGTQWVNAAPGAAMTTTTMAANWPDAIICYGATGQTVLHHSYWNSVGGTHTYITGFTNSTPAENLRVVFNSTGVWSSVGNAASWAGWYETNCNSAASTITTFYAAGRAFNFIGSSLASAAAPAGGIQFNNGAGVLAGDTALIWDNTNKRLGIGTAAPSSMLHVTGNSKIETGVLDLDSGYSIRWGGAASGIYGGSGVADMVFTVGSIERFRVNGSSGNVGIGTTAPASKLDVAGNIATTGSLSFNRTTSNFQTLNFNNSDGNDFYIDAYGGRLRFHEASPSNTERMSILAGGNVGIGTTNPLRKLQLEGAAAYIGMGLSNTNAGGRWWELLASDSSGGVNGGLTFYDRTATAHRMVISSTGNVGVGTATPGAMLDVNGNAHIRGSSLTIGANNAVNAVINSDDEMYFNIDSSNDSSGQNFYFATNRAGISGGKLLMRIEGETGNVGIGTTAPTRNLEVSANNASRLRLSTANAPTVYYLDIESNYDAANTINLYGTNGINLIKYIFSNNSLSLMPASGNVGIGTTSPSGRLHVNGAVYFQGLSAGSSGYYLCQDSATNQVTRGGSCSLSDIRLKRDVAPLPNALSAISTLRGVSFNWKDPGRASTDGPQIGLIAQDVEKVYPQAVLNNEDGTKGLNYDALMGPMVEAIKELKAANDQLQRRVRTLEGLNGIRK